MLFALCLAVWKADEIWGFKVLWLVFDKHWLLVRIVLQGLNLSWWVGKNMVYGLISNIWVMV